MGSAWSAYRDAVVKYRANRGSVELQKEMVSACRVALDDPTFLNDRTGENFFKDFDDGEFSDKYATFATTACATQYRKAMDARNRQLYTLFVILLVFAFVGVVVGPIVMYDADRNKKDETEDAIGRAILAIGIICVVACVVVYAIRAHRIHRYNESMFPDLKPQSFYEYVVPTIIGGGVA